MRSHRSTQTVVTRVIVSPKATMAPIDPYRQSHGGMDRRGEDAGAVLGEIGKPDIGPMEMARGCGQSKLDSWLPDGYSP
jgi:hypothetical protein